jgi:hypothetical protein
MRETLLRFINIQPLNDHEIISWAMALIWLLLILNCVASLRQQPITSTARLVWAVAIICVPILGMASYLVNSLFNADYSFLKFLLGSSNHLDTKNHAKLQLPSNNPTKSV